MGQTVELHGNIRSLTWWELGGDGAVEADLLAGEGILAQGAVGGVQAALGGVVHVADSREGLGLNRCSLGRCRRRDRGAVEELCSAAWD